MRQCRPQLSAKGIPDGCQSGFKLVIWLTRVSHIGDIRFEYLCRHVTDWPARCRFMDASRSNVPIAECRFKILGAELVFGQTLSGMPCAQREIRGFGIPMSWRSDFRAAALVLILTAPTAVSGEEGAGTRRFAIPAGTLEIALRFYSEQSGFEVLYDAALVVGKRSDKIEGSYSPEAALGLMLRGSGLRPRFTSAHAVILVPVPQNSGPPVAVETIRVQASSDGADRLRFEAFGEALLRRITTAIQRDPTAGRGSYRATVRIWVNPDGTISSTEIVSCSGSKAQARALGPALSGTDAGEASPRGLPQPLVYRLDIRSPVH